MIYFDFALLVFLITLLLDVVLFGCVPHHFRQQYHWRFLPLSGFVLFLMWRGRR